MMEENADLGGFDDPTVKTGEPMTDYPTVKTGEPMKDDPTVKTGEPMKDDPTVKTGEPMKDDPTVKTGEPMKDDPTVKTGEPMKDDPNVKTGEPMKNDPNVKTGEPMKDDPTVKTGEPVKDVDSSDQPINKQLNAPKPVIHSQTLKIACAQLLDMYIDDEYVNLGREVGKLLRWGQLEALGILNPVLDKDKIVNKPGVDIFGNPVRKNFQCECTICHRTVAASRFAPHLENCMGMGRSSSRISCRRLAAASDNSNSGNSGNASGESSKNAGQAGAADGSSQNPLNGEPGSVDDHFKEDDDDEDWSLDKEKKTKSSENVAAKRKGPLSRVGKTDGVGKRHRGASLSVRDSPASLGVAETSIQDEE